MKESQICTRIVNTFLDAGHEAFKIPDMPRTAGTKFNRVKGYDIIAAIRKDALFIEVKLNKSLPRKKESFLNLFQPSQINRFNRVTEKGNAYCFAFLCVYKSALKAKDRRHDLFIIPWTYVMSENWEPDKLKIWQPYKKAYLLQEFFETFPRF